jgi:hypothetical protein
MVAETDALTTAQPDSSASPAIRWTPALAVIVALSIAFSARALLAWWAVRSGFVEYNADGFTRVLRGYEWLQAPRWEVGVWPPLHSWVYGATLALWDDVYLAPKALNFTLGLATIGLLFGIGLMLAGWRAGFVAALLAALLPLEAWLSISGMSEPLFHALIACGAFGLVAWWLNRSAWMLPLAGLAFGLATAVRYEGWFYVALFVPLVLLASWHGGRDWRYAAIACVLAVSFMAIWLQQNAQIYGDPLAFVRHTEQIRVVEDPANLQAGFLDRLGYAPAQAFREAPLLVLLGAAATALLLWRDPPRWAGLVALVWGQAALFVLMTSPFASLGPGVERFLLSNILLLTVPVGALIAGVLTVTNGRGSELGPVPECRDGRPCPPAHASPSVDNDRDTAPRNRDMAPTQGRRYPTHLRGILAAGLLLALLLSFAPDWRQPPTAYPASDTRETAGLIRQELERAPAGAGSVIALMPSPPAETYNEGYALRVLSRAPGRVDVTHEPPRLFEAVLDGRSFLWIIYDAASVNGPPAERRQQIGAYAAGWPPPPATASADRSIVAPGGPIRLDGAGFLPGESVSSWWTAPDESVLEGPDMRADERGEIAAEVDAPLAATPGQWALTVAGQQSQRQAIVRVEVQGP